MAPENRGYHVDACEAAVLDCSASVGSCLRLAAANLTITPELVVRSGCLGAGRSCLLFGGRRGGHLPRDTTSISCASLKQLDDRSLLRIEQFSRPLQSFQSFVPRRGHRTKRDNHRAVERFSPSND